MKTDKHSKELYLFDSPTAATQDERVNIWLCFPGPNSFALSSVGFLWLYKTLYESKNVNVERICEDTKITTTKLENLDLVGFSFTFDTDFLTIFKMLDKYKIPLKAIDRDENHPLVFAGGPVATCNPLPYSDFFDFFIIGDGEVVNLQVVQTVKENKGKSKAELLKILSNIEGIYVPALKNNVKKLTNRLENCIYTPILSEEAFFKNTFIIEMSRGCANRCGFCIASYINLPLRCTPYEDLINTIELGLKHTNKIALLGAQISAHPHFHEVCKYIYDKIKSGENIEMSVSSLRVDAVSPEVIKTLVAAGQKNTTLAIEAGSERLRKVINKNLAQEQIIEAVKTCREHGLKGVKFYGILGLPTETQEDIEALVTLARELKTANKGFNISFGFSTFVPKPHTPFQWSQREDSKSLELKTNYLKRELHKLGIETSISSSKWDYYQAVLSLGDETLGDFVLEAYKQGGKLGAFKAATKKFNINLPQLSLEAPLPWDLMEMNPGKEFLVAEYKRLLDYQAL